MCAVEYRERTPDELRAASTIGCEMEVRAPKDDEPDVLVMIGSTSARDSYGDRIELKGWDLKRYKSNPVFQPTHNYSALPLGRALKVWKDKDADALMFKIKFATDLPGRAGEEAALWYAAYKAKYVRGTSVGFMPLEWKLPQTAEEREAMGLGKYGVMYTKSELLELSAVPVPSNPEALVQLSAGEATKENVAREVIRVLGQIAQLGIADDEPEDDGEADVEARDASTDADHADDAEDGSDASDTPPEATPEPDTTKASGQLTTGLSGIASMFGPEN